MELIGTRFGQHVDVGAGIAAVAGIIRGGLNFEFLNGVGVGNADAGINIDIAGGVRMGDVVDGHAVHLEIVRPGRVSVDAHILGAFPERSCIVHRGIGASGKAQDLRVVAIAQRKAGHFGAIGDAS